MNPYIAAMAVELSPEQRAWFEAASLRSRKDPALAFALDLILGIFGAHDFYLGDYLRGTLMLIGTLSGVGVIITFPVWIYSLFVVWSDCEALNDATDYWLLSWVFQGSAMPPSAPPKRGRSTAPIGGLPVQYRPS